MSPITQLALIVFLSYAAPISAVALGATYAVRAIAKRRR